MDSETYFQAKIVVPSSELEEVGHL